MEALSNMATSKEEFRTYVTIVAPDITDETWEQIVAEIESRVANELDEILTDLAEDYLNGDFD
jgi:polyhydroxyalkanoate synthesis regulator protein